MTEPETLSEGRKATIIRFRLSHIHIHNSHNDTDSLHTHLSQHKAWSPDLGTANRVLCALLAEIFDAMLPLATTLSGEAWASRALNCTAHLTHPRPAESH